MWTWRKRAIALADDLALVHRPHLLEDMPHHLVHDTVQDMSGVAGLPVALRLLPGFAVADIADALYYTVRISGAGVGLAVGGEGQPRPAVAAVDVAGQKRAASGVHRNVRFQRGGVGAGFPDAPGGLELSRRDNLQMLLYLRAAFPAAENAGIGQVAEDAPDAGMMPGLAASGAIKRVPVSLSAFWYYHLLPVPSQY